VGSMEHETVCSFCGKSQHEVKRLVASPDGSAFICDTCIEICKEIVKEQEQRMVRQKFSLPIPMELKAELDKYIIGQDSAKRTMAVAVYNHYKRLNYNLSGTTCESKVELDKSNILLIGPTGVGKTLIAKTLAKILKVPFACVDATTLTEAGYVGDDVETILTKLLINADYDIRKAEMGIIYIDEIDKIAKKSESRNMTRDVSGEGVQQALLKILEGTVSNVPQINGRKHPHQETVEMDTSNILFICGGAFVNLANIIEARRNKKSVGFLSQKEKINKIDYKFTKHVRPSDLVDFGLIPEFVGRLPIVVGLEELDEKALVTILTSPKNSLVSQFQTIFKIDGIELSFEPEALSEIAKRALELSIGARGLRTVLEECMLDVMYSAPSDKTTQKIIVTGKQIQYSILKHSTKEISAVS